MPTEKKILSVGKETSKKTLSESEQHTDFGIQETLPAKELKYMPIDSEETQSSASKSFSSALNEESQGSLKQLNDASAQLLGLAKSLGSMATMAALS